MIRWIIFIAFVLFIDFYAFQSVKIMTKLTLNFKRPCAQNAVWN